MFGWRRASLTAALVAGLTVTSQFGHAATMNFGAANVDPYIENGFQIDIARIVNGNCGPSGNPCMALNDNEASTLTKVGGGTFTLDSFWFELLGNGTDNTLRVRSFVGAVLQNTYNFPVSTYDHNDGGQTFGPIANITSIIFDTNNGGNVRIDDIVASFTEPCTGPLCNPGPGPGEVPIPGAFLLMGTVLAGGGGFAAWRRRRERKAS